MRFLTVIVTVLAALASHAAEAQVMVSYAVPHAVSYVPMPVAYAAPVAYPAPVAYAVARPLVGRPVFLAAPTVAYRPMRDIVPAYIAPAVVARPVVTARYRPILGGTVYRARYHYAPANIVVAPY